MQRLSSLLLALAVPALAAAADGGVSATPSKPDGGVAAPEKPVGYLKTADDKELYALGYSFGRNLQVFDLSPSELEIIRKAISEGATDKKPLIPLETSRTSTPPPSRRVRRSSPRAWSTSRRRKAAVLPPSPPTR